MKRTLSVGMTAATFLMTAALAAQAPAPQQPPATTPQAPPQAPAQTTQKSESMAGKITVNGCIEKADQQASALGFVLTSASLGPASSAPGSGAVGTSGAAGAPATPSAASPSSSANSTYRLDADAAQLTPHVGHRVEIVGSTMPESSATPSARPGEPADRAAATAPNLKVESIKMVAQTCASR